MTDEDEWECPQPGCKRPLSEHLVTRADLALKNPGPAVKGGAVYDAARGST